MRQNLYFKHLSSNKRKPYTFSNNKMNQNFEHNYYVFINIYFTDNYEHYNMHLNHAANLDFLLSPECFDLFNAV